MGKYTRAQNHIFSVFDSATWKAEAIKTIPQDVIASNLGEAYIRVAIVFGKGINRNSVSGVCIIDIYTAISEGPTPSLIIADKLDNYLQNKSVKPLLSNSPVQFGESSVVSKGADKANLQLLRTQYTIPFNLFGVS
jgi:hypothetical protein